MPLRQAGLYLQRRAIKSVALKTGAEFGSGYDVNSADGRSSTRTAKLVYPYFVGKPEASSNALKTRDGIDRARLGVADVGHCQSILHVYYNRVFRTSFDTIFREFVSEEIVDGNLVVTAVKLPTPTGVITLSEADISAAWGGRRIEDVLPSTELKLERNPSRVRAEYAAVLRLHQRGYLDAALRPTASVVDGTVARRCAPSLGFEFKYVGHGVRLYRKVSAELARADEFYPRFFGRASDKDAAIRDVDSRERARLGLVDARNCLDIFLSALQDMFRATRLFPCERCFSEGIVDGVTVATSIKLPTPAGVVTLSEADIAAAWGGRRIEDVVLPSVLKSFPNPSRVRAAFAAVVRLHQLGCLDATNNPTALILDGTAARLCASEFGLEVVDGSNRFRFKRKVNPSLELQSNLVD